MNVYILGIDHAIQLRDGKADVSQHDNFEKLLRELIAQQSVAFIGEETFPDKQSIAKEVAASLTGISWAPIEMSHEARVALGITDEQNYGRNQPIFEDNMVVTSKAVRVPSDGIREEFMLWRAVKDAAHAKSILILCGFMHVDELRQRFEKVGHRVTADSLCKREWYTHPDC